MTGSLWDVSGVFGSHQTREGSRERNLGCGVCERVTNNFLKTWLTGPVAGKSIPTEPAEESSLGKVYLCENMSMALL